MIDTQARLQLAALVAFASGVFTLGGCQVQQTPTDALALGTRKFLQALPEWRRAQLLPAPGEAREKPAPPAPTPDGGTAAPTPAPTPPTPVPVPPTPGPVKAPAPPATAEDVRAAFKALYEEKVQEDQHLETLKEGLAKQHADRYGWLSRTTAAVVFAPALNAAQPALVQSFSLRNFFQSLSPSSDPDNIQHQVEKDIGELPKATDNRMNEGAEKELLTTQVGQLKPEEYSSLVQSITDEVVKDNWWFNRTNIPSIDLGLAAFTIGESGSKFDSEVDNKFPQFLFGLGVHFGGFEASCGAMLYRDTTNDFQVTPYFGFSIELYRTLLNSPAAPSAAPAGPT